MQCLGSPHVPRTGQPAATAPACRALPRSRSCRTRSAPSSDKHAWIEAQSKEALLAAIEAGFDTALFQDSSSASSARAFAAIKQLFLSKPVKHDQDPECTYTPVLEHELGRTAEVARMYVVSSAPDLKRLQAMATRDPPSLGSCVVMDAQDWQVIPAENLIALLQSVPGCKVMGVARTVADARTLLGALEVGVVGVVLRTPDPAEVRALAGVLRELRTQRVPLESATVTRVVQLGVGDRVCVDTAAMLQPGEGLLVGSFARALFLVHSECGDSAYITSRPFRVNAGAVHCYALGPEGRTAYLSELHSGASVLVVAPDGRARTVPVGRCKLENRPLVLVEAQTEDGAQHSVILQNAETVKLVGWEKPLLGSVPETESPAIAVSVAELAPGHRVLLHRPPAAARHTGLAIKEWLVEK